MSNGLPTRPLGKTGVNVSILCLGGWHIGQPEISDAEAERIMHAAIDEGITFFDNAWDYHDGRSEELMGKALATGGRRQKVFLMTKNCGRDAEHTRQHLDDSLRRLKTDVIDLWQFHEINYDNDPEWILERGALAEALKAQQAGKVRFLGFTGHKHPDIFLKMLGIHTAWATCQLPVNVCDYFYRSSIHNVLPVLKAKNIAAIGMKSLGGGNLASGGKIVAGGAASVDECIRFALSQEIASLVVGVDSMKVLLQDVAIARNFQPMPPEERDQLLQRIKPVAGDGRFEPSKSTQLFDGPYHRRQHGFPD
jgi:predicted aldo/keto reductase-like oxidoreductase